MSAIVFWVLMLMVVFIPPLVYLAGIRRLERFYQEPWSALLKAFASGAVLAVVISIILEAFLIWAYDEVGRIYEVFNQGVTVDSLVLVCVIAPVVEEGVKGFLTWRRRNLFKEEEDGMIYGSSVGLGFAATENIVYGLTGYFVAGVTGFVTIVLIRSISAVFLHASATGLTGYGLSHSKLVGGSAAPFFLGAIALHAGYNFLASLSVVFGEEYGIVSLAMAILVGYLSFRFMKKRIALLDHGAPM